MKWIVVLTLFCSLAHAQGSDILGFDLTFGIDCKAEDFEKQFSLSFIGDNSAFYQCDYELTDADSGVSIRIHGRYEYVVREYETFTPILVITKNDKYENHAETSEQYFVQLIGFQANEKVSGSNTVKTTIGKLTFDNPNHYIRVYNGKPMVNGNIYISYDFTLEEREWQSWQRKMPYVTKITRGRP